MILLVSGGVFIVIFVGIGLACITLAFEYWWYKYRRPTLISDVDKVSNKQSQIRHKEKLDPKFLAEYPAFRSRTTFLGYNSR